MKIAEKLEEIKKSHVGYYLIKEGTAELDDVLEIKKHKKLTPKQKSRLYIAMNILIPLYFCLVLYFYVSQNIENMLLSIIICLVAYIPISEIYLRIQNYLMGKFKNPILIPKMNFENGIPEENATFVVIPTILKSKEKVKEMFEKLEVYYLANKSENLYFALLGDCSEEKKNKKF